MKPSEKKYRAAEKIYMHIYIELYGFNTFITLLPANHIHINVQNEPKKI